MRKHSLMAGVSIVETIVVIAIIVVFSALLIVNFPGMQKELSASRAVYSFAQKIKTVQEMALSSKVIRDSLGNVINVNGYGIYIDAHQPTRNYMIYANLDEDPAYNEVSKIYCLKEINPNMDCIIEEAILSDEAQSLTIQQLVNTAEQVVSIYFKTYSKSVTIQYLVEGHSEVGINLGLTNLPVYRKGVFINEVGLIEVK